MSDADNLKAIQQEFEMRQNPAEYKAKIQAQLDKITNENKNMKRNAFARLFNEYGQHLDQEKNAQNYASRSTDVLAMVESNLKNTSGGMDFNKYNKDLSRRQIEINDWYYQDKLETLFFLQMFFMTMLTMSIVFYFQKTGMLSSAFAGFLTVVLLTIVGCAGMYRWWYTGVVRDSRWWYKRRFAKPIYKEEKKCGCEEDPFVEPKTRCPAKDDPNADCLSGNSGATSIGQVMDSRNGNSALNALSGALQKNQHIVDGTAEDSLDRAQNALEAQTIAYMQGANPPPEKRSPPKCEDPAAPAKPVYPPGSTNVALNQNILPYF